MEFVFTEDQQLLQQTVRDFLEGECTVEHVRAMWDTETGRSPEFWQKLAEIGVTGLMVPEQHGGLGMNEVDMVLVLEETGRAGLAEPVRQSNGGKISDIAGEIDALDRATVISRPTSVAVVGRNEEEIAKGAA